MRSGFVLEYCRGLVKCPCDKVVVGEWEKRQQMDELGTAADDDSLVEYDGDDLGNNAADKEDDNRNQYLGLSVQQNMED